MTATYDPDLGQFLRTFNIRYTFDGNTFELPIKATSWREAEYMLDAVKRNGVVHSELIEVIE